jgi:hypothetical protein
MPATTFGKKEIVKMALEAATLEAAPDTTEATENTPPERLVEFEIDGYDKDVVINLEKVHEDVRMHLLRTAAKNYVVNRVSTAVSTAKKANSAFDSYDAAQKNDPLQELVPVPEGKRQVVDYATIIEKGINALYSGDIGRRGRGEGTTKPPKDKLNDQLLRTLTQEVFAKRFAADPSYKYFTAKKEVEAFGGDATAYYMSKIASAVAAGADEKKEMERWDAEYVKPARILVGLDKPTKFKDLGSIL